MYGSHTLDTRLVDTFHGPNPQFKVGVYWVLYKYRYVYTLKAVSKSLHGKRIGRGTSTNPKYIDAILQCEFYMLRCSHLSSCEHTRLFLNQFHPRQSSLAISFKTTRLSTWFPNTSTKHMASKFLKLLGCCNNLLFSFSRTWSGNYEWAWIVTR